MGCKPVGVVMPQGTLTCEAVDEELLWTVQTCLVLEQQLVAEECRGYDVHEYCRLYTKQGTVNIYTVHFHLVATQTGIIFTITTTGEY